MKTASDKRIQMTKRMLSEELIKAASKRKLEDISVKEICENAGVSRVTFYKYYKTLDDLMDETAQEAMSHIPDEFPGLADETESVEQYLRYIGEHRSLYLLLIENGYFSEILKSRSQKLYDESLIGSTDKTVYDTMMRYSIAGTAGVLHYYLENEPDITPKKFAGIMRRFSETIVNDIREMAHK